MCNVFLRMEQSMMI